MMNRPLHLHDFGQPPVSSKPGMHSWDMCCCRHAHAIHPILETHRSGLCAIYLEAGTFLPPSLIAIGKRNPVRVLKRILLNWAHQGSSAAERAFERG